LLETEAVVNDQTHRNHVNLNIFRYCEHAHKHTHSLSLTHTHTNALTLKHQRDFKRWENVFMFCLEEPEWSLL